MRSAYLHVLADAATSVLAILALAGGRIWGFGWLDPVMGLAGAVLVTVWAQGLLRDSGRVLRPWLGMQGRAVDAALGEVVGAAAAPGGLGEVV